MSRSNRARGPGWKRTGPNPYPQHRTRLLDTDTLVSVALAAFALNTVTKAASLLARSRKLPQ